MEEIKVPDSKEVMLQIRSKLKLRRGYASRVAGKLNVSRDAVYNVAWGKVKNATILKALVAEATADKKDPFTEIITEYIKNAA